MKRVISIFLFVCFLVTGEIGPCPVYAQDFRLPAPGVRVTLSPEYNPPILKGIKVHPDNPFRFDFILDKGDSPPLAGGVREGDLKQEATRLIKYFLASLTIPENDLWVNLSPYEKDRIIPQSFGLTEMGRDLLAEDYMLKQITASLIYPEGEIGKKFWKRIYEEAGKKFGTTNIPVNTFNKVWIVPQKAVVYENAKAGTAYVVESKLKVMLEQDYLAMSKHTDVGVTDGSESSPASAGFYEQLRVSGMRTEHAGDELATITAKQSNREYGQAPNINALGSQIVREIVIPELTKEVNEDKNFAQLRQVYNSLILATWYKKKIKDSILSQVYSDKNKVAGVNIDDPQEKEMIYQQYLKAFKKGVYNYIKEEIDPVTQEALPRKYFSGGEDFTSTFTDMAMSSVMTEADHLGLLSYQATRVEVALRVAEPIGVLPGENENPAEIWSTYYQSRNFSETSGAIFETLKPLIVEEIQAKGRGKTSCPILLVGGGSMMEVRELRHALPDTKQFPMIVVDPARPRNNNGQMMQGVTYIQERAEAFHWPDVPKPQVIVIINSLEFTPIHQTLRHLREIARQDTTFVLAMNHPLSPMVLKTRMDMTLWGLYIKIGERAVSDLQDGRFDLDNMSLFARLNMQKVDQVFGKYVGINRFGPILQGTMAKYQQRINGLLLECAEADREGKLSIQKEIYKLKAFLNKLKRTQNGLLIQYGPLLRLEQTYGINLPNTAQGLENVPSGNRTQESVKRLITKAGFDVGKAATLNPTDNTTYVAYTFRKNNGLQSWRREDVVMNSKENGGIDFNSNRMDLQIQNNGSDIKFYLDPAMLQKLQNAPGFVPVIINIQPLTDLRQFLDV